MAVTLQGSLATSGATTTASVTPTLPTHQADDILLVCAWIRTTTGSLATPTNWTAVNAGGTTRSTVSRYHWFWKRATSSAETNPAIAVQGGASEDKFAQAHVIRGVRTTGNPFEAYQVTTGTADPGVATGITTITDNTLILSCGGNEDNVDTQVIVTAANAPTAMGTATSTSDRYRTSTTGADGACFISPGVIKTTAGATGNVSHDFNGATRPGWGVCVFAFAQSSPAVALNTADATAFGTDTTPTLEFTGTDADSDDVQYEIEIDGVSTFVIDEYAFSNSDSVDSMFTAGDYRRGQSFTGNGQTLGKVTFWINKGGSPTGNVTANVYAHTGTFGAGGTGTGVALATSDTLDITTLSGTTAPITFVFSGANQITLANGTNYVVVLSTLGVTFGGGQLRYAFDQTSHTHSGNYVFYNPSAWGGYATVDTCFKLTSSQYLDKTSSLDTGFVNTVNGADTDPFTSGQKASFTVQAGDALATGTYYWRVRAKDPSGTNTYGAWTSARSFSITTGGGSGPVSGGSFFPFF